MFYDLNITRPTLTSANVDLLLDYLTKYKYHSIAFTTDVSDDVFTSDTSKKNKKAKNSSTIGVPPPFDISTISKDYKIKIYNRINITIANPNTVHAVNNSSIVKQYDIISYQPANGNILKVLSGLNNFDILSYNPLLEDSEYFFSRKMYQKFVSNGIFLELTYSLTLYDATTRRCMIQRANIYQCMGKSKNVIVSSSTNDIRRFRTPYDVMSICYIFGLSEEQAKAAITKTCEKLILSSRTRKRGKCAFEIILMNESPSGAKRKAYDDTDGERNEKKMQIDSSLHDNHHNQATSASDQIDSSVIVIS